jgi:hypothetical protein
MPAPLSRFQTGLGEISGYSEGWGLYAERFMDELGAFDRPATRLGFLVSQTSAPSGSWSTPGSPRPARPDQPRRPDRRPGHHP